jgi:hypothetical protein
MTKERLIRCDASRGDSYPIIAPGERKNRKFDFCADELPANAEKRCEIRFVIDMSKTK